ncbi:hypothetical protein KH5H1_59270 [Corallococcus caeni]|uniref:Class I SAM-dependent methyltransferase n=1 Tax=Corallococcus caeni TaxID=3082388 RepID=A0ABQ6QQ15_9BACT|nr:hypothetical protein KH5H1_59270 [Corallococcus sp. KH5-1]GMU06108.1 hypothetical protein ASNO1_23610 [Corallococcus sp. NO1]
MRAYLRNARVQEVMARPLTPRMQALLDEGVVEDHGFWVLRRAATENAPRIRPGLQDATGYECFANKLHVSDFVGSFEEEPWARRLRLKDQVGYGLRLARELQRVLPADGRFVIILGCSNACTLRFHLERPGEHWLTDDLEGYRRDALLELSNREDLREWVVLPS